MAKIEFTKEMALKMGRHEAMEQHCLVRYVKACREFGIPQKDFAVMRKLPRKKRILTRGSQNI